MAAMESSASPTTRLFNTLLVTMLAILLGLFCIRLKLIIPEEGDVKGMGFFVGSIAFPLLIFNTIATAELGSIHFSVIAACSLGKISVMVLTWLLAFLAYKPSRSAGQRILTASVFAFFAVASNDFAIGFPVIDALYGDTYGMDVYIAGNAVVGSFVFVPLTMIAFAIGGALKGSSSEAQLSPWKVIQTILRDLATNPVIVMTCLGLVFKLALGGMLVKVDGKLKLPSPFQDLIDLFTGPFAMLALFLTGTSLNSAQLAVWPCGLVLMKVVVCAYLSYVFGTLFISSHEAEPDQVKVLSDFTFFYGAIPTSSAPIVFASRFDPDAAELMATAVLFGLILAGPIMFVTAYSLNESGNHESSLAALTKVQFTSDAASIFAGFFFLCALVLLRRKWNFKCPAKQLLAWYGIVALCYSIVSISSNPSVSGYVCESYRKYDQTTSAPMVLAFGVLQHTCSLLKLVLQWMLVCGPKESTSNPRMPVLILCACLALALLPTFFATPNTLNEICKNEEYDSSQLILNVVWSYTRVTIALGLATYAILKRRNKHKGQELATESQASDSEEVSDVESSQTEQEGPAWKCWGHIVPRGILMAITVLSIVKDLIQVVNAAEVHFERMRNTGSFAAMLLLESVLEHAQEVFLVAALFFDETFAALMLKFLPKACPCIYRQQTQQKLQPSLTRVWTLVTQADPCDMMDPPDEEEEDES